MGYKNIQLEKEDGIGIITINRPEKYNALNLQTEVEIGSAKEGPYGMLLPRSRSRQRRYST